MNSQEDDLRLLAVLRNALSVLDEIAAESETYSVEACDLAEQADLAGIQLERG